MRIAITGSTGMIGSRLVSFLLRQGHELAQITRQRSAVHPQTSFILWDPALDYFEEEKLEGFDVIIHLAGANVGEVWSARHKKEILESRRQGTQLLCQALSRLKNKPKLLLSASAIGYYGNHAPIVILDEDSRRGEGFLANVCQQWEDQTRLAQEVGIRVVCMRMGVVLSSMGGALAQMWLPFQMGLGGVLGSGRQMMSWIVLDEIPYIIDHLIKNSNIHGAVNLVAPYAVSNAQFTKTLGEVIKRPTVLPMPGFAVRMLFGEMGQSLLLEGAYVVPRRLQETLYQFHYPDIRSALEQAVR